jgi:hypothetical protein
MIIAPVQSSKPDQTNPPQLDKNESAQKREKSEFHRGHRTRCARTNSSPLGLHTIDDFRTETTPHWAIFRISSET